MRLSGVNVRPQPRVNYKFPMCLQTTFADVKDRGSILLPVWSKMAANTPGKDFKLIRSLEPLEHCRSICAKLFSNLPGCFLITTRSLDEQPFLPDVFLTQLKVELISCGGKLSYLTLEFGKKDV